MEAMRARRPWGPAAKQAPARDPALPGAAEVASSKVWDVEELVSDILARLPAGTRLPARLVCTRWNRIVMSQPIKSDKPCGFLFLTAPPGRCYARMFDPALWAWVTVPVPRPGAPRASLTLVRSEGNHGLVAFAEAAAGAEARPTRQRRAVEYCEPGAAVPQGFWVGNPMTNRWKRVPGPPPPPPRSERGAAAAAQLQRLNCVRCELVVTVDPEQRTTDLTRPPPARYKIVVMGFHHEEDGPGFTATYDSATAQWTPGAPTPPHYWTPATAYRDGRVLCIGRRLTPPGTDGEPDQHPMVKIMDVLFYSLAEDRYDCMFREEYAVFTNKACSGVFYKEETRRPGMPRLVVEYKSKFYIEDDAEVAPVGTPADLRKLYLVDHPDSARVSGDKPRCYMGSDGVPVPKYRPEYLYLSAAPSGSCSLALHEVWGHKCQELPLPFREEQDESTFQAHEICAFYPRFDLQP